MKRHYVVQAIMRHWSQDFQCSMGAVCALEELGTVLKHKGVRRYKIKSIDGEPVINWDNADWIAV